jgi:hypothetical protein
MFIFIIVLNALLFSFAMSERAILTSEYFNLSVVWPWRSINKFMPKWMLLFFLIGNVWSQWALIHALINTHWWTGFA